MTLRKKFPVFVLVILLIVGLFPLITFAADHGDAPLVRLNSQLDINDIYMFQSPSNASRSVMILTTNPAAGVISPNSFSSKGRYILFVDKDGDGRSDISFRFKFSPPNASGVQKIHMTSSITSLNTTGKTGEEINLRGGGKLRAGIFDDPFFFDLIAFRNSLTFCKPGTNFFHGLNVMAIVLEIPKARFGNKNVGLFAVTRLGPKQIDRMGRPAIATVLISSKNKDAFNRGIPVNDQRDFRDDVVEHLTALGAADPSGLADVLLPDILTFDTSSSSGFLNGRRLDDDVIDAELALVSNGAVKKDCVGNDSNFSNSFPYLAPANP